jgi:hypothetical protein
MCTFEISCSFESIEDITESSILIFSVKAAAYESEAWT